jgi:hypothetical protein
LCHFLSLEGYAFLLDCGIYLDSLTFTSFDGNEKDKIHPIKALLPPLDEIDIKSLDVILISNHYSIFALPLLTEYLGFEVSPLFLWMN